MSIHSTKIHADKYSINPIVKEYEFIVSCPKCQQKTHCDVQCNNEPKHRVSTECVNPACDGKISGNIPCNCIEIVELIQSKGATSNSMFDDQMSTNSQTPTTSSKRQGTQLTQSHGTKKRRSTSQTLSNTPSRDQSPSMNPGLNQTATNGTPKNTRGPEMKPPPIIIRSPKMRN